MGKVISGSFGARCKRFYMNKGVTQPECQCGTCWAEYFHRNPTVAKAASRMLIVPGGEQLLVNMEGTAYAQKKVDEQEFLLLVMKGKSRDITSFEAIREARGRLYLKHLLKFIEETPALFPVEEPANV